MYFPNYPIANRNWKIISFIHIGVNYSQCISCSSLLLIICQLTRVAFKTQLIIYYSAKRFTDLFSGHFKNSNSFLVMYFTATETTRILHTAYPHLVSSLNVFLYLMEMVQMITSLDSEDSIFRPPLPPPPSPNFI